MLQNKQWSHQQLTTQCRKMWGPAATLLRRSAALRLARLQPVGQRRWMSRDVRVPLERLAHKSRLHFQVGSALNTHVEVEPALAASDFALHVSGAHSSDVAQLFSIQEERVDDAGATHALRITSDAAAGAEDDEEPVRVKLTLPHLIDLSVSVVNGGVELRDKIEGDVKIAVGTGDIVAHKLRCVTKSLPAYLQLHLTSCVVSSCSGTTISLKANNGNVTVASLVEGESVQIVADAVSCKRAMAGTLTAKIGGKSAAGASEFGAIYSSACSITSSASGGALKIGNVHGYLRVLGDGLERVQVDSVNGSLELEDSGDNCSVVAHFDSWSDGASSSILVGGDVHVSVHPSAPLGVELHGTNVVVSDACEFEESELEQLDEDYAIFTGELKASADSSLGSQSTGKINVGSAKSAAMRTSFFASESEDGGQEDASGRAPRLLVHATKGQVKLDQLDWMANLKRKHLEK